MLRIAGNLHFLALALTLVAAPPVRAAQNTLPTPAKAAGPELQGGARDLHTNFYVSLPVTRRPFPEPLAPGQQPGFKVRGIKGWAWTPEQYLAEIPYLVRFKMNFLMNCYSSLFDLEHHPHPPKDTLANRWWEDLPDAKKRAYEKVVHECQRQGIQFCFSMNPNLHSQRMVNDGSPESFEQLYKHYAWMQGLGVKWFNLSLDDATQGVNASSQARVANELFHRLRVKDPSAQMIFCPTWYWGDGTGTKQKPYLETLARELDPDMYLFWTGTSDVCKVTRRDAETYRRICGHRLFLWDNYPVNDGRPTMHLGPVVDRDPDLCDVIDGYISNPLHTQNQINRLPLATCADYAYNPRAYDPARSIGQAILLLAATQAQRETLRDLVETYPGMLICSNDSKYRTSFNPVRFQFQRVLGQPNSRQESLGYVEHLQAISDRFKQEFPGAYGPAKETIDDDIAWLLQQLAAKYP
jgi:hypothetical protein